MNLEINKKGRNGQPDDDDPDDPDDSDIPSYETNQKDPAKPNCYICLNNWYDLVSPGTVNCPGRH